MDRRCLSTHGGTAGAGDVRGPGESKPSPAATLVQAHRLQSEPHDASFLVFDGTRREHNPRKWRTLCAATGGMCCPRIACGGRIRNVRTGLKGGTHIDTPERRGRAVETCRPGTWADGERESAREEARQAQVRILVGPPALTGSISNLWQPERRPGAQYRPGDKEA